jgi:hypothetical protein
MIVILSSSDTASLSSLMICRTTVATFNLSLSDELGLYRQTRFLNFLLWLHAFPICLRCLWLLYLRVLTRCSCTGPLWWGELKRKTSSQGIVVLFSFAVLLSHGCSLGMTLDEVSLLPLWCNYNSSAFAELNSVGRVIQPRNGPTENAACNTSSTIAWCQRVRSYLIAP